MRNAGSIPAVAAMKKIIARVILGICYVLIAAFVLLVLASIIAVWPVFVASSIIAVIVLGFVGLIAWAWENS